MRRLNAYVAETEPWKLAKDPERAGDLDVALRPVLEGVRVAHRAAGPTCPRPPKAPGRAGSPDLSYAAAGSAPGAGAGRELEPLFPRVPR